MNGRNLHLAGLAALALGGCSTPEQRAERAIHDATDAMNEAAAAAEQAALDEFREAVRHCELAAGTLLYGMEGLVLQLPAELYATRDREPTAGRIACVARWARGNEYELTIVEAR